MKIGSVVILRESVPQELQENFGDIEMTVYTIVDEIAGNSIDPVVGVRPHTMKGAAGDFSYFHMSDLKVVERF